MSHCPKCGSYEISGPFYVPHRDKLRYFCCRCGYAELHEPDDRKRDADAD